MTDNELSTAGAIGVLLAQRGETLSTAESCTGGGVAQALTAVAGSSAWFEYGWVTYANVAKISQLGVNPADLTAHGAVSKSVAEQMALGAARVAGSRWAVATTGVAGPGGGSAGKPVGTVWIGWCNGGVAVAECFLFEGDRAQVRTQAVNVALAGLYQRLKKTTV